ncbi:MAG: helix-turn-helix transcriptional regulator [Solirubrobacterales bacterium]|nr:helix-turn-helix transcriptional regulator [Solirubrobacterales bacterium]
MPFRPFENQNCGVARAAEVFTERWTMLIFREVAIGRGRFSEIRRNTGVASNILSDRLQTLVDQGIVVRVDEQRDGQDIERYVLTKKGQDAQPILLALLAWGNKYAAPDGAPRELFHEACGHVANAKPVCDHCGGDLKASNTKLRPGPGANKHQVKLGDIKAAAPADSAA